MQYREADRGSGEGSCSDQMQTKWYSVNEKFFLSRNDSNHKPMVLNRQVAIRYNWISRVPSFTANAEVYQHKYRVMKHIEVHCMRSAVDFFWANGVCACLEDIEM